MGELLALGPAACGGGEAVLSGGLIERASELAASAAVVAGVVPVEEASLAVSVGGFVTLLLLLLLLAGSTCVKGPPCVPSTCAVRAGCGWCSVGITSTTGTSSELTEAGARCCLGSGMGVLGPFGELTPLVLLLLASDDVAGDCAGLDPLFAGVCAAAEGSASAGKGEGKAV